jgi:hypothetical protein
MRQSVASMRTRSAGRLAAVWTWLNTHVLNNPGYTIHTMILKKYHHVRTSTVSDMFLQIRLLKEGARD